MTRELSETSLGYEWLLELWDVFAPSVHVPAICWARLPAWLVRGLTWFLSAGNSGTRLLNSFCTTIKHSVFPCLPSSLRANSAQCIASHVKARISRSSSTERLLVVSKGQWECGVSAQVSAVSPVQFNTAKPRKHRAEYSMCIFSLP